MLEKPNVFETTVDPRFGRVDLVLGEGDGDINFIKRTVFGSLGEMESAKARVLRRKVTNDRGRLLRVLEVRAREEANMLEVLYEFPYGADFQGEALPGPELIFCFEGLLESLAALQGEKNFHGDVRSEFVCFRKETRFVQLIDRLIDASPPLHIQLGHIKKGRRLYMPPEVFEGLLRKEKKLKHNAYKSDLFQLSMLFLERLAGPETVQALYDFEAKKFRGQELEALLANIIADSRGKQQKFLEFLRDFALQPLETKNATPIDALKVYKVIMTQLDRDCNQPESADHKEEVHRESLDSRGGIQRESLNNREVKAIDQEPREEERESRGGYESKLSALSFGGPSSHFQQPPSPSFVPKYSDPEDLVSSLGRILEENKYAGGSMRSREMRAYFESIGIDVASEREAVPPANQLRHSNALPLEKILSPADPLRQPFTRPSQSPLPSTKPPIPSSNQAHPPIKSAIPFSSKPSEPPSKSQLTSPFSSSPFQNPKSHSDLFSLRSLGSERASRLERSSENHSVNQNLIEDFGEAEVLSRLPSRSKRELCVSQVVQIKIPKRPPNSQQKSPSKKAISSRQTVLLHPKIPTSSRSVSQTYDFSRASGTINRPLSPISISSQAQESERRFPTDSNTFSQSNWNPIETSKEYLAPSIPSVRRVSHTYLNPSTPFASQTLFNPPTPPIEYTPSTPRLSYTPLVPSTPITYLNTPTTFIESRPSRSPVPQRLSQPDPRLTRGRFTTFQDAIFPTVASISPSPAFPLPHRPSATFVAPSLVSASLSTLNGLDSLYGRPRSPLPTFDSGVHSFKAANLPQPKETLNSVTSTQFLNAKWNPIPLRSPTPTRYKE